MPQCIVYTLMNAYLLLLPQLEKSIIVCNLWNMTPVQGKVYVFQPAQRENGIFFTKNVKRIEGLSSVSSQRWYTGSALGGPRGVVQQMMDYS